MIDEKKIEEAAINASIEDTAKGRVREDYVIGAMADHELGFQDGFKAGINWLKENLWHDASEEPKENEKLLVERVFNGGKVYFFAYSKDGYYFSVNNAGYEDEAIERGDESRWLYIEDLIKGGK